MPVRVVARPSSVEFRELRGRSLAPPGARPGRLGGRTGMPRRRRPIALVAIASPSRSPRSPSIAGTSEPAAPPVAVTPAPAAPTTASLAGLPLDFVANAGQWGDEVGFVARKGAVAAAFEPGAVQLALAGTALRLGFVGAASTATVAGEQRRAGTYNFLGNDPAAWHERVAAFASVRYAGLYDGIDVRFRELGANLEYDVLIAPHADLSRFVVRPDGALRRRSAPTERSRSSPSAARCGNRACGLERAAGRHPAAGHQRLPPHRRRPVRLHRHRQRSRAAAGHRPGHRVVDVRRRQR